MRDASIAIHRYVNTHLKVAALLAEGRTRVEIARMLGLSKSTVSYHARRLGFPMSEKFNRRYDWDEVQRYYDEGHSITECQEHFGFARQTWHQARKRGAVKPRPQAIPITELLVAGRKRNRSHIKRRLLGAGLKENRCERCGLTEWLGRPLAMELHHVNGDGNDNRLENLELLCGNCHSQTDNWGGRGALTHVDSQPDTASADGAAVIPFPERREDPSASGGVA
jgi:DNA-binding transcriptional ArsR family regulator